MIVIIDYGLANLKSVKKALELFTDDILISNKPEDVKNAERIILPGVGSFSDGIENLQKLNLIPALNESVITNKTPFLGICLGMQLLATKGYEHGEYPGLDWIPGEVRRFQLDESIYKIPHMGWDDITIQQEQPLFSGIRKDKDFYFVHSYYFISQTNDYVTSTCDYGIIYASSLQKDNIFATQFHPEKSQQNGLKIIENFLDWKPA